MTIQEAEEKGYKIIRTSQDAAGLFKNDREIKTWCAQAIGLKLPTLDHPEVQLAIDVHEFTSQTIAAFAKDNPREGQTAPGKPDPAPQSPVRASEPAQADIMREGPIEGEEQPPLKTGSPATVAVTFAPRICSKWHCGWYGDLSEVLIAPDPFNPGVELLACPKCREQTIRTYAGNKR